MFKTINKILLNIIPQSRYQFSQAPWDECNWSDRHTREIFALYEPRKGPNVCQIAEHLVEAVVRPGVTIKYRYRNAFDTDGMMREFQIFGPNRARLYSEFRIVEARIDCGEDIYWYWNGGDDSDHRIYSFRPRHRFTKKEFKTREEALHELNSLRMHPEQYSLYTALINERWSK